MINAKGKGEVNMYFVNGLKPEYQLNNQKNIPNELFWKQVKA
jgi:hypothetical protein